MASASRVQFRALQAKKSIGCVGGHAIGLNFWKGTEGSPMSSLKCDRWQRLNLESRLAAVCTASGYWCSKPRGLCHGPQGVALCWVAGRPATGSPEGHPTGVWGRSGLPGSCVAWHKRNKVGIRLGALLNTVQGSLLTTHHAHTQTHTHSGLHNGLTKWLWRCG